MDYIYYEGGPDVFAEEGKMLMVTDLLRNTMYRVSVVDFYIDENMTGYVFFDGQEMFAQTNIESYDVLERLFYSQFSIE
jgi:hypothetical protein